MATVQGSVKVKVMYTANNSASPCAASLPWESPGSIESQRIYPNRAVAVESARLRAIAGMAADKTMTEDIEIDLSVQYTDT